MGPKRRRIRMVCRSGRVKKAELELSSDIGGDHYVSRLANPGLKETILNLYRHPGKYVESIRSY